VRGSGAWHLGRVQLLGTLVSLLLLGLAGRYFWMRRPRARQRAQIQALRREAGGDQDLVERLIYAELEREPELSYEAAARRARERLKRDRA